MPRWCYKHPSAVELTRVKESNPTFRESVSKVNKSNGRELRGKAIVDLGDQVKRISTQAYKVASQSGIGEYRF